MIDLDRFAAEYGLDLGDTNPPPAQPAFPPLSPVGERLRDDLLHKVGYARASLEILESLLQTAPNDDTSFDAVDQAFTRNLEAARGAFERFRGLRECSGEC